ncbi:MAG: flagellar biosynthesis protein FlgE [Rhodoferax ferrireducens]|uniref:Flagellar hook protein FlgE n=1 Tax=Rhodoferax ferrireducens TaxID=192843 RepID=A0A1W9KRE8_9BURK|nr:MAG: flagellar biosynthesis protein FlgE [Rhodoferax ferrireducens]
MSFQTGLSGLNAAARNLDVIGNNIANANTTGMKASRTEFSGLVSSALSSASSGGAGIGVEVANVAQLFTQGNISTTNNNLDVAINGSGFFQLTQSDGSPAYTRDGSFKLDTDGYIITNNKANLMGYPTDENGKVTSATIEKLQLPTNAPIAARATTTVAAELNLEATAYPAAGVTTVTPAIPPTPRATYGTTLSVYDSQGVASPVNLYFEKLAVSTVAPVVAPNTWKVFTTLDTANTGIGNIVFDSTGKLTGPPIGAPAGNADNVGKFGFTLPAATGIPSLNPNVAGDIVGPIDIVFDGTTQFGTSFAVSNLTQDGYTAGELTGLNIGDDGVITANYSNGETQAAGQLALADFRNIQGLTPLGGNAWAATNASGLPVQGSPGQGKFGILRSGALEESNVDLTKELVDMMTAQRSYQANAQTIKTQDQIMSTLVNLR